ncbi:MAG: DEAD/DEAH box helicase [Candidatus Pacebacteria bacterium]|nr:DEAD/DEAH box helicase [Candidatus Paceibacterota bacterium]
MQINRFKNKFGVKPRVRGRRFFGKKKNFSSAKLDISRFIQRNSSVKQEVQTINHKFSDFEMDDRLKSNISKKGYVEPTPIQDKIIPIILEGKDVVGIANTGTGKTAAFLIPTINSLLLNRSNKAIVIVPTRELALQIEKELKDFSFGMKIFSVLCIGGTSLRQQMFNLSKNNDFIVGTPGRIKDLVTRRKIDLSKFKTVVLDEADRMFDMGFINDIRFLIERTPKDRQTLLFSATFPSEIEQVSKEFLKDYVKISVRVGESSTNVNQDVVKINGGNSEKLEVLYNLLNKEGFDKVLIFGKTKYGVDKLSKALINKGFKADVIHGDKTQSKRKRAIDNFKRNQVKILVATDVAARGLDINDISHVINYDIPSTYEDYIHRIGRTGRGNKKGEAITFV